MRRSLHLLRSAAQLGSWSDAAPAGVPSLALFRALPPFSGPHARQFSEQASPEAHDTPPQQQSQPTAAAENPPPPDAPGSRRRPPAHRRPAFTQRTAEFVGRVFADAPLGEISGLDAAAAAGGSEAPAPPAAEEWRQEAVSSYTSNLRRHQRRWRERAGLLSRAEEEDLDEWLQANAAAVEAFSAAAAARGLSPDTIRRVLAEMHRSGGKWLLTVPGTLPASHTLAAFASDVEPEEEEEEASLPPEGAAAAAARQAEANEALAADAAAAPEQQLVAEGAAVGAGEKGSTSAPASFTGGQPGVLRGETALESLERLLAGLGLPAGSLPRLLGRCPQLLWCQQDGQALAALAELLGGREALAAAAAQAPRILLLSPATVQDRLIGLALHAKCPSHQELLALVAACPALLTTDGERVAKSARFLGSLLPLRPYTTLVSRFPVLLTRNLPGILSGLQRHAPQRLVEADLQLVVSQQPTLLLGGSRRLLATWRQLEEICGGKPEWEAELRRLTRPPRKREEGTDGAEGSCSSSEGSSSGQAGGEDDGEAAWFVEVYGTASAGEQAAGAGAEAQQQGEPFWFQQDEKGRNAALRPGAYGTLQRQWPEGERLRARALARLLDARHWQLQRLRFLLEEHPAPIGRQRLLDLAFAPKASFDQRYPGFSDWLASQQPREFGAGGSSGSGGGMAGKEQGGGQAAVAGAEPATAASAGMAAAG